MAQKAIKRNLTLAVTPTVGNASEGTIASSEAMNNFTVQGITNRRKPREYWAQLATVTARRGQGWVNRVISGQRRVLN